MAKTDVKSAKISAFEQEIIDTLKKISEFKEACEANIVSIIYKNPELLYETKLAIEDFSHNVWKVYFAIANDLVLVEEKKVLDDITVGLYLEKHLKLQKQYDDYGGYDTITKAGAYVKEENFDAYTNDLQKWNKVVELARWGIPVKDRLSDYCDMKTEEIYNELEAFINHTFMDVENDIKSYNAFEDIDKLIDELDKGVSVGMPLHNCYLLNKEIGGFNSNGNIYGLGANSGVGKSTTAINYIAPSVINYDEKMVMIINEEDEKKVKKELLVWVANNIFKQEFHKYILRDGKFTNETKELLKKCADWLEVKKENRNITIIPLEKYSVKTVIKIIKKYSSMGVKYFILDTLKESSDAKTDEIFKSMTRDMVDLYDVVKPSAKNVGLFVTYQLGKASIKQRYLTNNEIGMAKSIVDVMSVNLMMRRPFDDEFEGGKKEIIGYKLEGKNGKSKIPFKLNRDK
ncbi:helicase, partial [Anaerosporobacter sp.]